MSTPHPGAVAPSSARYTAYSLQRGATIEGLQRVEHEVRLPRGNEVQVRMRAVALNYRDLMVANGLSGRSDRPIVPASDGAGEVVAVGPEVTNFRIGDRVVSNFFPDWLAGPATDAAIARALGGSDDGVLAEHVTSSETAWIPMPAHLDFIEAATLPCAALTAWHALFAIEPLTPGSTVALLGTGGVSIWALQLAKAAGHRVIVTSSDDAKLARVRALGADATVNYRQTPDWGSAIRDLAGGTGVDRVLDIGGPDTIGQSIAALRTGGTLAIIGRLTGTAPAQFDPAALFAGAKRMIGLMVGSRAMALDLARFVAHAHLRPVIDRVFGFDQAADAYRHLASAQHIGKIVIRLGAGSPQ